MRVIAGRLRGRRLGPVPEGVRPTSDRVRESLFNVLGDLEGSTVLDAFAGSGALGIEALSRGAARVVFLERARASASALRTSLHQLGLDPTEATLIVGDALRSLRRLARDGTRFDLVLLDPPYASDLLARTLAALVELDLLAAHATLVAEAPKRHPLPPVVDLEAFDERHYGDTRLLFFRATSPGAKHVVESASVDAVDVGAGASVVADHAAEE